MLPSIKKSDSAKTKVLSKREEKKRINIRWNSTLYFQIGLVVSLLLTLVVVEMDWEIKPQDIAYDTKGPDLDEIQLLNVIAEMPPVPKKVEPIVKTRPKEPVVTLASKFKSVDNTVKVPETKTGISEPTDAPMISKPSTVTPKEEPPVTRGINQVDSVPVFPGCEGLTDNSARMECLSSKIRAFVGRKFNTDRYSEKYAGQMLRISVQFTVDADGNVVDILARSKEKDLEKEATKVISKLPKMEPAKEMNKSVPVMYRMPILFRAEY